MTETGSSPRADSKCVAGGLAAPVSIGRGRWNRLPLVSESASAATDLDLISYLKTIPDSQMRPIQVSWKQTNLRY